MQEKKSSYVLCKLIFKISRLKQLKKKQNKTKK